MSSNNVAHLITKAITILQHFATLHHTSSNCTSPHLSTLHFLSFTLHYPLIWLNPITFPFVRFHLTPVKRHSIFLISKPVSKIMNPFTALKNLSTFTSLFIFLFFSLINPSLHITLLYISTTHFTSRPFTCYFSFHANPSSGSRVVPCGPTEGKTDKTKLVIDFRNFANAPKNVIPVAFRVKWNISNAIHISPVFY